MPEHGEGDTAMHPLQVADPDPWFAQAVPTMHSSYTGTADGHIIALVRLWCCTNCTKTITATLG